MDTTAQIAAKGCKSTGITEDLAKTLYNQLGKKITAVVELSSHTRTENEDGKEKVVLNILMIEPAPTQETADHLRNLARAFDYERRLADGQLQLETTSDLEPKVADVLKARPDLDGWPNDADGELDLEAEDDQGDDDEDQEPDPDPDNVRTLTIPDPFTTTTP